MEVVLQRAPAHGRRGPLDEVHRRAERERRIAEITLAEVGKLPAAGGDAKLYRGVGKMCVAPVVLSLPE